ncbi:glutathione S-transferase [Oceanisphaera arctica]|uniref:glutathione transferase n=1 Tax=Oceanisphaera arctica TaxID=641510 RepID=A0A2P5TNS8_9GAMM|nr:glutathione S-transferase [Oceanisphaera arctica]PPL17268.1 glutathione S-transferase [Oceanisphaera arctica]GHA20117.1 glutathione S-transferase [Oceanisphaera arctica]
MIQLHHLNNSRSQRILWLLEELGLEYEIKHYRRDTDTQLAPDSLKRIHPLGKAPVLTDGGMTLAESGAIIDYLAQTYGRDTLLPANNSPAWWDYVYWLHYAEGSLMPPLLIRHVFDKVQQAPVPFFIRPIVNRIVAGVDKVFLHKQIQTHLNFVADHLSCHDWFAGKRFGAADIQMSFPLEAAMHRSELADSYPRLRAYVSALQARPAYLRALKAGGPYLYGPKARV